MNALLRSPSVEERAGDSPYGRNVTLPEELAGFVVGVTADRRAEEQVLMLERLGLEAMVGPVIRTVPIGDDGPVRTATEKFIADPPDILVANTAVGMRSWFGLAATWGRDEALLAALAAGPTKIVARGPKSAGTVHVLGLEVWWRPEDEQLAAVADGLLSGRAGPLEGRRVAVQLHGDHDDRLGVRLAGAGATVVDVPVYRWELPSDPAPALRLVERCVAGGLDAVTFTAAPAVDNLLHLAGGLADEVLTALNGPVLPVCIGPVCAAALRRVGVTEPVVPTRWRLGSMVRDTATGLRRRRVSLAWEDHTIVLQGAVVVIDGEAVRLTDRERAVLAVLARRPGGTVTRGALLADVWGDGSPDAHALEAVIGRLRTKLGPVSGALETVVRRGYRLDATQAALSATGTGAR